MISDNNNNCLDAAIRIIVKNKSSQHWGRDINSCKQQTKGDSGWRERHYSPPTKKQRPGNLREKITRMNEAPEDEKKALSMYINLVFLKEKLIK